MNTIKILGVPINAISEEQALDVLEGYLDTDTNHVVVTPNPEGVMQALRNPQLAYAIEQADLSLADGTGIVMAAKYTRQKIPGRVRGYDTVMALFERLSCKRKFTVYMLGAKPGVAEKAKTKLEESYPNLKVIGYHHGFFTEDAEIINEINNLSPDILLVGLGMPRQELWATENRKINARITMCIGGTIDVIAGVAHLPPPLLRKIGLEWLYRLFKNPSRFKRQLDIPRFMFRVCVHRAHPQRSEEV